MVKHSQSSQNTKFVMSLQYIKKKVRNKVDFLHATRLFYHFRVRSVVQRDTVIIDGHNEAFSM